MKTRSNEDVVQRLVDVVNMWRYCSSLGSREIELKSMMRTEGERKEA